MDESVTPENDLIALYTRISGNYFQIRLDLLDINHAEPYILIALDVRPGGTRSTPFRGILSELTWDYLVVLDKNQQSYILNDLLTKQPGINISTEVDTNLDYVLINIPANDLPGEILRYSIQVLIVCNESQPVLCDMSGISYPDLPSSDYSNIGILFSDVLPARTPIQLLRRWDGAHTGPFGQRHGLFHLLKNAKKFKIPILLIGLNNQSSQSALKLLGMNLWIEDLQNTGSVWVANSPVTFTNSEWNLPQNQISRDGISINMKTALANNASEAFINKPFLLGGILPESGWGDALLGEIAFRYIASHPWIRVIDPKSLERDISARNPLTTNQYEVEGSKLDSIILDWIAFNVTQNRCEVDIDGDGRAFECIMSDNFFLAIVNSKTGLLITLLNATPEGVFQWIDNKNPEDFDRQSISDTLPHINFRNIKTNSTKLEFSDPVSNLKIEYSLMDSSFQVDVIYPSASSYSVLLSPHLLGWSPEYQIPESNSDKTALFWKINDCRQIIDSSAPYSILSPLDFQALLLLPEDPDLAYPINFSIPFDSLLFQTEAVESIKLRFFSTCK